MFCQSIATLPKPDDHSLLLEMELEDIKKGVEDSLFETLNTS